ncbi:class I adenylate-forming enzyme family protein [Mesorhizobium sp.]|jgi:acyl-CoA synthetase (AMP-forming)/AMP-acid ligase II|uniref:class I adenylate-forming enzyme family protein n=1 Tax=Mesorhizobium sp. TaxID=1871066 RepID=UPI003566A5F7
MSFPATRNEVHYRERIVRCFADRPANLDEVLRDAVRRAPDRVALVCDSQRITYRQLNEIADRIARNLLHAGFRKGDRLALLLGNGLEFVYAIAGATRCGMIVVPMNVRQKRPEVEYVLNQCEAAGIIYDAEYRPSIPAEADVPFLRHRYVVGDDDGELFGDLCADRASVPFPEVAEEDPYCLLYTSGTTGKPKGAVLTHLSTIHTLLHYEHGFALQEGDSAILAVPASHVTGLAAIILTTIRVAGCIVIQRAFKTRPFLELASREKITFTVLVPAIYNLLLLDPDFTTFDLSCWKVAGFGGAPMPEATIEGLARALPKLALCNIYGSTETSSPVAMTPLGTQGRAAASVGKVLPCADIIVVDEQGREVAPGKSGELLIGGAVVVPGYWNNPAGNQAGFVMGYWVSGDIGAVDEDGNVHILDRKKDMINRAGFKIYCVEVEGTLSHIPGLVECAVIGKPDPVLGERVHAFIVTDGSLTDGEFVRQFCAERLSDYKVPDGVTFLPHPLPRNANGKVLKNELRERLAQSGG